MDGGTARERRVEQRTEGRHRGARRGVRAALAVATTIVALAGAGWSARPAGALAAGVFEPTPVPTATATPAPTAWSGPVGAPAPATAPPAPAASPAPAPRTLALTAGSNEFTVETAALDVTNLAFSGTQTVTSGTVSLTVLRFTADSAVLNGMTREDPCFSGGAATQHWKVEHVVPATATASLSGAVTLLATSLAYTLPGGATVTYDATNLPPVGVLLASGTLAAVQITATSLIATSAVVQQLSTQVTTC